MIAASVLQCVVQCVRMRVTGVIGTKRSQHKKKLSFAILFYLEQMFNVKKKKKSNDKQSANKLKNVNNINFG